MLERYKKYFRFKSFILDKKNRLNASKQEAAAKGDTLTFLKITSEIIQMNRQIIVINRKMKAIMDDMQESLQHRSGSLLPNRSSEGSLSMN